MGRSVGHTNFEAYRRNDIVHDFATRDGLMPAEFAALGEVWPQVRGDVLDIGVGGGRTTGFLLGVARSYRALDISPEMAAACLALYPEVDVAVGDARTLDGQPDAGFDLVLFSFNGIDYVDHPDRASVLASAFRVLRPGGAFVYSSHNLRVLDGRLPPVETRRVVPTLDPARLLVRGARTLAGNFRRHRNRRQLGDHQYLGADHALVNDAAYDYSLLTVYVDPDHERAALATAGFRDTRTIDARGRIDADAPSDPWIYYVSRKPAGRTDG